jgi:predicted transcriptional regulator
MQSSDRLLRRVFDMDEVYVASGELIELTTAIVSSYVSRNDLRADQVPDLIRSIHASLAGLGAPAPEQPAEKTKPAVAIGRSITDEYIVCLEDGAKLKMLKRYLRTNFGMSPDEYRKKWGLPADYPMVAPSYARRRSEFAKTIGLGRGVRKK